MIFLLHAWPGKASVVPYICESTTCKQS
ncbi:hypothetical protein HaLaN_07979, partial [Haematococcus lacustris]